MKNFVLALCVAATTGACSVEVGEDSTSEQVGEVSQRLSWQWIDRQTSPVWGERPAGMAISGSAVYSWRVNGYKCVGTATDVCGGLGYAPTVYYWPTGMQIKGVGISKSNGRVYTWYRKNSDGTPWYSEGNSTNLQYYRGATSFTVAYGFNISDLIEADHSDNGKWYYYWRYGFDVYRTTGTVSNANVSGAVWVNTWPDPNVDIWGIAFGSQSPAQVYTWYSDHWYNQSTDSTNLNQ